MFCFVLLKLLTAVAFIRQLKLVLFVKQFPDCVIYAFAFQGIVAVLRKMVSLKPDGADETYDSLDAVVFLVLHLFKCSKLGKASWMLKLQIYFLNHNN